MPMKEDSGTSCERAFTCDGQSKAVRDAIQSLLTRPVAFHRVFSEITGSATAGLMLSQGYYWEKALERMEEKDGKDRKGWFHKTQEEWQTEIGLSRCEQETARRVLRKFDFWQEDRRGVPAKLYFRVDLEKLVDAVFQVAGNQQPRMWEVAEQGCQKLANKDAGNPQSFKSTETTPEITSEREGASLPMPTPEEISRAFEAMKCQPFGSEEFRAIWAREWMRQDVDGSFSDCMERAIQRSKSLKVSVPGMFYDLKREIEKTEAIAIGHELRRRTPL